MACKYTYLGKTYEAHEFDDVLRAMEINEAAKWMPAVAKALGISESLAGRAEEQAHQTSFEVAPDPANGTQSKAWNKLSPSQRTDISAHVADVIVPKLLKAYGATGDVLSRVGSYQGETNPSLVLNTNSEHMAQISSDLGFILSQAGVTHLSTSPFDGSQKSSAVVVDVGAQSFDSVQRIYNQIRKQVPQVSGQSYANGQMVLLNKSDQTGITTDALAVLVDRALDSVYTTANKDLHYSRITKDNYDSRQATQPRGGSPVPEVIRAQLRDEAARLLQEGIEQAQSGAPGGTRRASGRVDSREAGRAREKNGQSDARAKSGAVRRADVNYSKRGDGRDFTGFFSNISLGFKGRPNSKSYAPVIDLAPIADFVRDYNTHRGHFDDHIGSSIPAFRELQTIVGSAIAKTYKSGDVLDIGASEGAFIKAISHASQGKIKTVALDPNFAMAKHFNESPVEGASYDTSAFSDQSDEGQPAWVEDDMLTDRDGAATPNPFAGKEVRYYQPDRAFDVVHEAMVFQFISGDREGQVARAKQLMKPNGVLILEEKFVSGQDLSPAQFRANEAQKDAYKEQYFTKEEIAQKAKAVGVAEVAAYQEGQQEKEKAVVGMNDRMVSPFNLENVLISNFAHTVQFWDSGNFKGYLASDSKQALESLLSNMLDTNSEFSTVNTPMLVHGSVNFSARSDGKSGVLSKDGKFKAWPAYNQWTRAEYNDVVSLLPAEYRNDTHRTEPVPTEGWDLLASAVLPEIKELNEAGGEFKFDSLGNIRADARRGDSALYAGAAKEIAKAHGVGVFFTGVKTESIERLQKLGYTSEYGLGAVLARATGSNDPVIPMASGTINNTAYGTMMSYQPRGFPMPMFSARIQDDMFKADLATSRTSITEQRVVSSNGATKKVKRGNTNSAGQRITGTKQGMQNFWSWFDDSKATDAKGKPLLLYHSTNADIQALKTGLETVNNYGLMGNLKTTRSGIFATPTREFSQEYLEGSDGQNVMPIYMALQRPFDSRSSLSGWTMSQLDKEGVLTEFRNTKNDWSLYDNNDDGGNPFVSALKRLGYDGAIFYAEAQKGDEQATYMAFESAQIKSSTGNLGTFSSFDDRVNFSARDQGDSEAFKRWSNDAPLVTSEAATAYDFKTGAKVALEAFHGTGRGDRVGEVFQKKRATSGPMAYFTSSPDLASNYATGKADTSRGLEDNPYESWFKYQPKGQRSPMDIIRAWHGLDSETKAKISERLPDIRTNDDGEVIYEKDGGDIGSYAWNLKQTQRGYDKRGNPLAAAVETWLTSGAMFGDEQDFMQVLKLAGFPVKDATFDHPHETFPFVYKTYVKMGSPLVTSDIPASVTDALLSAAKTDRSKSKAAGADSWDKNARTLKEWVNNFTSQDNDQQAYVWTSIPDKVSALFKSLGYDGIIDWSGKGGGHAHPVYIPFEETQVKSALGTNGKFDESKKNIMRSARQIDSPEFKAWFGDWKAVSVQNKLDEMKPLKVKVPSDWRGKSVAEMRDIMAAELDDLVKSKAVIEHPELGSIRIGRKGAQKSESTSRDPAKILTVADLRNTLPSAIVSGYSPSNEQGVDGYTKLLLPIDVDGLELVAVFAVRHQTDGQWYYNTVTVAEKEKSPGSYESSGAENHPLEQTPITGLDSFIRQKLSRVNPDSVSKVVDADGSPLVVYHGGRRDLTEFKSPDGVYKTGIFFTADADVAKAFGHGGEVYEVYLSLKNPFVMDAGGSYYASIPRPKEMDSFASTSEVDTDLVAQWAIGRGYDGVILKNVLEGRGGKVSDVYIASKGAQVKSAIGNNGNFDGADANINHSKRHIVGRTTRVLTPEQLRGFKDVGWDIELPSLKDRAKALWKDAGKKLAQGIVDQFAPIRELSKEAYGLLRLAKGAAGSFEVFLKGGKLKLTDNVYDLDETQRGGVIDKLLIPMQGEHHDFLRWIAANRADKLMVQGKEHLFTQQNIDDIKTLEDGSLEFDYTLQHGAQAGQTTRVRSEMFADSLITFNAFSDNVLDMAEQSGLIDGAARKIWASEFYVPFYRVSEENGVTGASVSGGSVRQQAFKKLKGGTDMLNHDLLDNTLMNWAHLLDASAKNRAAKASLEAAEAAGVAIGTTEETARQMGKATGNRNGVVWFMDGGQQHYYLVDDPYVLQAITSLEYAGMRNPMMNAMSAMKNALTVGVTASPFFKVRNLIRDSIQVIGVGNIGYNPLKNLKDGWALTNPENDIYFRLLAGGGTIHFGTMYEGSEAKRVQSLVESGVDASTILTDEHKVKAFYRKFIEPSITAYNELGNRGEAINRAALYDQLVKQGVSHADASLQARDLMDFSMQGSFTSIRFLTQVLPFFNARLQGMYKLGRAANENPKRMAYVTGAIAMASLALLAAYGDDDDWKKREEFDRNNFWWFKVGGVAFRIPKPFELGAIGTLAERSAELVFSDEMTFKRFAGQIKTLLSDNLSMNLTPQLVKPMLDIYANKDSFSGRPIETMGMDKLKSEYRFTGNTSMVARAAGTASNAVMGVVGAEGLSPVQVDSLIRGYFGWLGTFVVGNADMISRYATNQPTRPSIDVWKTATGSMISSLDGAPSRYVSHVYDQAKEMEQAYGTWAALRKEGKVEEAREFKESNDKLIKGYRNVESIKGAIAKINQRIRIVERSDIDRDAKRLEINRLKERKDQFSRKLAA